MQRLQKMKRRYPPSLTAERPFQSPFQPLEYSNHNLVQIDLAQDNPRQQNQVVLKPAHSMLYWLHHQRQNPQQSLFFAVVDKLPLINLRLAQYHIADLDSALILKCGLILRCFEYGVRDKGALITDGLKQNFQLEFHGV